MVCGDRAVGEAGGRGRAGAAAHGRGHPRADVPVCGGDPEARRKWRQIGSRKVRVATKLDELKVAWIVRQKTRGEATARRLPSRWASG